MNRMTGAVIGLLLCLSIATHADEFVYRGTTGLITFLKSNIRIADTLTVGGVRYLHYFANEGEQQIALADVIETRLIPYDLADPSAIAVFPDTLAIPIPRPTPLTQPKSVTVTSIPALKTALADNTVDEIVVANGTYLVAPASHQAATSLWIGADYAARTRPIVVRAQMRGGVSFDGGGAQYFGGISFNSGSHDQTWDGFNFVNGNPTSTGVITIGGYTSPPMSTPSHHITMRYINIFNCSGSATTVSGPAEDHAVYISQAIGGPHDFLFEYFTVDDRTHLGLASAFQFYHSDPATGFLNGWNITMRNITVRGTQQAFILWDETLKNILISEVTVKNALRSAIRYETTGSTGIVIQNFSSTGSSQGGFSSSEGSAPAGVTFINDSFK
jgi:hypothetical protein